MGSDSHYPEEGPAHRVSVEGLWIDRYAVTNGEFAAPASQRPSAPGGELGEGVGDPVGDVRADVRQVVEPDVLGGALLGGEDAQLALGAVDGLLVGAVGVLERDLPVVLRRGRSRNGTVIFSTTPSRLTASANAMNVSRSS